MKIPGHIGKAHLRPITVIQLKKKTNKANMQARTHMHTNTHHTYYETFYSSLTKGVMNKNYSIIKNQ